MTQNKNASGSPDNAETPETETPSESLRREASIEGNSVVLDALRQSREQGDGTDLPTFTLKRDDNRPLRFTGNLVGYNEVDPENDPRGTQVQIFITGSGKIITAVYQWQRKENLERERHKAQVHRSPEDALNWLIGDGGDKLGRSSREAWDMACNVEPLLKGHDVEVID